MIVLVATIAMEDIWSNDQSPKKKSCKYEHLFTKNLHELPIKYEQYSLLKTGMIPNLFMNFFTAEDKAGVKAMKGFWSFISSSSHK